jgi:hypothetical protein
MSTPDLLQTGLLLGVYVALAGLYGLVYAIARLGILPLLRSAPPLAGALHGVTGAAIVLWTPLQAGWKGLIVASGAAVIAIPPLTWRLLQRSHETELKG